MHINTHKHSVLTLSLARTHARKCVHTNTLKSSLHNRHVETWAKRHLDPDGTKHVFLTDVTGGIAQLNIQGPLSRLVMQELTDTDVSEAAFPFRTARDIAIGYARVLCARITYVGELGYELHIPVEHALHVYERVVAAGEKHGMVHAGLKALASLRMEKAYRDYGHDMDNTGKWVGR